ncbi:DUF2399 domain-containing protein [Actinoplanes sp. NPDC049599]|uniref:DUF2399 domain-containing protein n=1 Tax=Actinoplanes sp. NPDC049599 TaxID=3363903 RepID=UPI0037B07172
MQAAVRAGSGAPLLCLSGNPASVGSQLLRHLVTAGVPVRYHGDFDWPGVAIAGRVIQQGALPWRMAADGHAVEPTRKPPSGAAITRGLPG